MKSKLLLMVLGIALALGSCTSDEVAVDNTAGDEATVTISAQLPSTIASRSYSDGYTATVLKAFVYQIGKDGSDTYVKEVTGITFSDHTATFSTRLMKQYSYHIVLWAQAEEAPYTFDVSAETPVVNFNYDKAAGNNENRDAFYKVVSTGEIAGDVNTSVTLVRELAQLNIGTTKEDFVNAGENLYPFTQASVTVDTHTQLALLTGEAVGNKESVTFDLTAFPQGEAFPVTATDKDNPYVYLAMNYLLVGSTTKSEILTKVTMNVSTTATETDAAKTMSYEYTNVPVQRNYQTNIYGNLFTNKYDITLTINPEYEKTSHNKAN